MQHVIILNIGEFMKPIYSKEEVTEIANRLGFKTLNSFYSFLLGDYDLFEVQGKGIEDNGLYVAEEKEEIKQKMEQLKIRFGYDLALPPEELILKTIAIIKQYNIDCLMERFKEQIDEETAERLVEYAYTHGNCGSLVSVLTKLHSAREFMVQGGSYGHRCVCINDKVYDITGESTIEDMKGFVASEGGVPVEEVTIQETQLYSNVKLIDYIVLNNIKEDKAKAREEEQKKKEEELKTKVSEPGFGRRIEKSAENPVGWEDQLSLTSIDTTMPVVICLPGSATTDTRYANGMCKSVEEMLGISGCETANKPCQIYGLYYDRSISQFQAKKYFEAKARGEHPQIEDFPLKSRPSIRGIEKFAQDFVEQVFKPIVQDSNGNINEPKEIARRFRNIHFVSFCFGSVVQSAINQELRCYLQATGLDLNTIEKLESQICVIQTAPFASETQTNQTTINFISLADDEISTTGVGVYALEDFARLENQNVVGGITTNPQNNPIVYVKEFTTKSDDEHFGEHYLHLPNGWGGSSHGTSEEYVGGILPLCAAVCLRRAMENAVFNVGSYKYTPLRADDVIKPCGKYINWAKTNPQELPQALMDIYNKHVNYNAINLIESVQ